VPERTCRVCGSALPGRPLLRYENQPKAAQHLPSADDLAHECGVDLEIFQCGHCGLVQLGGEPVDYWREVIRASSVSPEMMAFRERQFVEFVKRFGLAGKRVLEPGCGRGESVAIMQRAGAEAHGLEFGEDAVAAARAAGLAVERGYIAAGATLPGAPFDAFYTLNYMEHVPDPGDYLRGIWGNLATGGVGIVEVPNFEMISRAGLFSEFITDHLCYFTPDTLAYTLALHGFEVLSCDVVWHDYVISAVVRRSERPALLGGASDSAPRAELIVPLDVERFRERHAHVGASINAFITEVVASGGRLAIWGAGHQALTIMAMFGLARHTAYVVDSAPFKQGLFTPATHIPIVAPDLLASDPVEAVIVMAASYSDEVVRIIGERFGDSMRLAVLREDGIAEAGA
jgi:2-polyprenyl-3-methyl-5-hydroxy-6-metoxy-1,4-benzoquinol methylase